MEERTQEDLLLPFEDSTASRRGFLQLVGFGIAGASLTGCSRGPVQHAIPALEASREYVPGRAYWIASTCGGCEAGCGVLAKCRDGRPIKLEGTPDHPVSAGGLCAAGQGSVLSLYDSRRFVGPQQGLAGARRALAWSELDRDLMAQLDELRRSGGRVRLLTGTINSPSTRAAIERFLAGFEDARHVAYDGLSASAMLEAYERTHGQRILPRHRFEFARTIASFDADFLSTWISPVEFTAGYSRARELDAQAPRMSKHFQLEARTSLTGCRADERVRLAPWEVGAALGGLCDHLERKAGSARRFEDAAKSAPLAELVERMANELWATRGESLVVVGADDVELQVLANYANDLLGSYGATLDVARPSQQRLGDDRALVELERELAADEVDLLIVQGVNPAYDLGGALSVERAKQLVACAGAPDETSDAAHWVVPEPHFLEAWNDAQPYVGTHVLSQPTIPVLRDGRTLRHTLSAWSGDASSDHDLVRAHWQAEVFPRQSAVSDFDSFFESVQHDGFLVLEPQRPAALPFDARAVRPATLAAAPVAGALGLVLYPKAGMLDGRHGHNPWLHELPDPVSKIVWDNYACLSPATAARLEFDEGDLVAVSVTDGGAAVQLPVHIQLGQHDGVVAVALGYGRRGTDRFSGVGPDWVQAHPTVEAGGVVGASAAAMISRVVDRAAPSSVALHAATVGAVGGAVELASTQDHHSLTVPEHLAIEGHETRDMVLSTTFGEWEADPSGVIHTHPVPEGDLWTEDHEGPTTWGLAIDLAKCTGCSACVVSCQAENNVPVVGRDEVLRHREMSWLRIDRYFQGDGDDELRTLHQPMMCQQCDHAPCESVCPVLATVHSAEGLNQQVYNRCVGTRYCANTCPYKVRRFNWFDYPTHRTSCENHSLNPDVTVRSARRDGEVLVLRAAHPGGQGRGEARRPGASATGTSRPRASSRVPRAPSSSAT